MPHPQLTLWEGSALLSASPTPFLRAPAVCTQSAGRLAVGLRTSCRGVVESLIYRIIHLIHNLMG
eukprot:6787367-Prymnesium_polylepis.1